MFRRSIVVFSSLGAVALALAGCRFRIADFRGGQYAHNPRVAEQPLSAANDSGVAFAHDARIQWVVLRDAAGLVTDVERVDFDDKPIDMTRGTHSARDGARRDQPYAADQQIVTVLTLPPGDYEVVRVRVLIHGESWQPQTREAVGGELPFRFHVEPHRAAVLGRFFCHSPGSECEPELDGSPDARARVVDLLAHPQSADERWLWYSWHAAAAREVAAPPPERSSG